MVATSTNDVADLTGKTKGEESYLFQVMAQPEITGVVAVSIQKAFHAFFGRDMGWDETSRWRQVAWAGLVA